MDELKPKSHGIIWIVVVIVVLLVAAAVAYLIFGKKSNGAESNVPVTENSAKNSDVSWEILDDGTYRASSTPPDCPSPLIIEPPTDLSKVISVLYPGQPRGGDYKPHGGLRFADGANEAIITAPMDATVVDGSRYLESGEIQYLFDFVNSCGIKYRLDHLRILSAPFAALAEKFPEAKTDDSRTTLIDLPIKIKTGDTIATTVGSLNSGNAGFDFGVYDLRRFNEASNDTSFQTAHANDKGLAWHGICWFNVLSAENKTKIKGLPVTAPGSQSDYCKSGVDTYTTPTSAGSSSTTGGSGSGR